MHLSWLHKFLVCFISCQADRLGELAGSEYDHVIVLPDVHGDAELLLYSLWLGAKQTNWPLIPYQTLEDVLSGSGAMPEPLGIPSRTVLVQLGDVANRGPGSKQCFAILFAIERLLGWQFVSLFGNHELMAFTGKDSRYVHEKEYLFFDSLENRAHEFSAKGSLWNAISSKSVLAARLGGPHESSMDTLFVHAGFDQMWLTAANLSNDDVPSLNRKIREVMRDPEAADTLLSPKESPLWTRNFAEYSGDATWCQRQLAPLLAEYKVARIMVGHSPLAGKRAISRCNGELILTDVMMSRWMHTGGQPVAILMRLVHTLAGPTLSSISAHYYSPNSREEETNLLWPLAVDMTGRPKSEEEPAADTEELPVAKTADAVGRPKSTRNATVALTTLSLLPRVVCSVLNSSPLLQSVFRTRVILSHLQAAPKLLSCAIPDGDSESTHQ